MVGYSARLGGMAVAAVVSTEVRGVAWLVCVLVILILGLLTLVSTLHNGR